MWDDISLEACPEEPARKIKIVPINFRPPDPTVEKNVSLIKEILDKSGKD